MNTDKYYLVTLDQFQQQFTICKVSEIVNFVVEYEKGIGNMFFYNNGIEVRPKVGMILKFGDTLSAFCPGQNFKLHLHLSSSDTLRVLYGGM